MVVFPAPFGPTRPKISPGSTARSIACDGDRPVVALDQALGPHDGAHPTTPDSSTPRLKLTLSTFSLTKRTSSVPVVGST